MASSFKVLMLLFEELRSKYAVGVGRNEAPQV